MSKTSSLLTDSQLLNLNLVLLLSLHQLEMMRLPAMRAGLMSRKLLATYKTQRRQLAKPATVNKELALVRHAFNVAMREWEWCRDNPMRRVSLEKVRNERDRWLSPEEEIRLLTHSVPWLRDILVFALNTDMRRGEILGLEWRAIDLHREVLVVMKSKNGEKRTVPLNSGVVELLHRKAAVRTNESFVFTTSCGTRIDDRNLTRAFYSALAKAEIMDFRFRDTPPLCYETRASWC